MCDQSPTINAFATLCSNGASLRVDAPPMQGYPVLNRPYAFLQWVTKYMDDIPEDYVLMAEPDHIFVIPPPLW